MVTFAAGNKIRCQRKTGTCLKKKKRISLQLNTNRRRKKKSSRLEYFPMCIYTLIRKPAFLGFRYHSRKLVFFIDSYICLVASSPAHHMICSFLNMWKQFEHVLQSFSLVPPDRKKQMFIFIICTTVPLLKCCCDTTFQQKWNHHFHTSDFIIS